MGPCTANARRPAVDSRCRGTTISSLVSYGFTEHRFFYICWLSVTGCAGSGNRQHSRAATLRESWLRPRQATSQILSQRTRRIPASSAALLIVAVTSCEASFTSRELS